MKKTLFSLLVAATVVVFGASAYASTSTTQMRVVATVAEAAGVSATDMNFGSMLVYDANKEATSTITVIAPNGTPYAISLDCGQHYNGTGRNMVGPVMPGNAFYMMWYELYQTHGAVKWGDSDYAGTYPLGRSISGTGTGAAQDYTVYGWASYAPAPGSYSDVVTVTVNY